MTVVTASLTIVLLFGAIAAALIGFVYFLGRLIVNRRTQIFTKYTKEPPPELNEPATVSYFCEVAIGRSPPTPLPKVKLTFSLANGHAQIDGASSKTVVTDANGNASVTLTPVSSGNEELNLHLEVGSKTGDEQPLGFKVTKSS